MNGKCFFFPNEEVKSFREAHQICHDTFSQFGFVNGKMYEPRDMVEFEKVYEMAEDFSKRKALTIWLGINDLEYDDKFVYNTGGIISTTDAPWGNNRKGGNKQFHHLPTFIH